MELLKYGASRFVARGNDMCLWWLPARYTMAHINIRILEALVSAKLSLF